MRGIIIDPFQRTVIEADGDWTDYRQIQAVVGGRFDDIRLRSDLILSVDDEGKMPHRPKAWFRIDGYAKALTGRALLTGSKPQSLDAWPVGEHYTVAKVRKMVKWIDPTSLIPADQDADVTVLTRDDVFGSSAVHKQLQHMMRKTQGVRPQPLSKGRIGGAINSDMVPAGGPLLERLAKANWSPPNKLPLFKVPNFRLSLPVTAEVRKELLLRLSGNGVAPITKPPFPRFTVEFPENLGNETHWLYKGPVIYYFDFIAGEALLIGFQSKDGERHQLRVRPCPVETLEIGRIVASLLDVPKIATQPIGMPGGLAPLAKKRLKGVKRSYVLIDLGKTSYVGSRATGQGSPKCFHSVRGHWRRIRDGRRVWIEEHHRGDERLGTTSPRYAVKRMLYQ